MHLRRLTFWELLETVLRESKESIPLKNPLWLKINFEKDHQNTLTDKQKSFVRDPGEKFFERFLRHFQNRGFFSGIRYQEPSPIRLHESKESTATEVSLSAHQIRSPMPL